MSRKRVSRRRGKDFWGPPTWASIHSLAICLRQGTAEAYQEFLWLLTKLMPCHEDCNINLAKKLKRYPPMEYLSSPMQAFFYTYMLHDLVNQHVTRYHPNSPKVSPPFDDVRDNYLRGLERHGPGFWGPPVWTMIHSLAATLLPENAEEFKRFFELLQTLLPDEQSRKTLKVVMEKYPIDPYLRNNDDAFFYTYMIHDVVNKKLGKRSPPYNAVKSFYFSALGEECKDCRA